MYLSAATCVLSLPCAHPGREGAGEGVAERGQGLWGVIKQQGSCFWEWKGTGKGRRTSHSPTLPQPGASRWLGRSEGPLL